MTDPAFTYVQARVQARHGGLPGASAWQAIEASHTPGQYLALARAGPLARWVDGLAETADQGDLHRTEQQLRTHWRRYVDEVARWQPAAWQDATRWFGQLPELALAQQRPAAPAPELGVGEPVRGFVGRHPGLATKVAAEAQAGPALDGGAPWLARWLRLMPRAAAAAGQVALLRRIAVLLMPRLAGDRRGRAALSEPVRQALLRLFRRHGATPVAVFAHLALVALDLERLRGGLVTRVLFAGHHGSQPAQGR